MALTLRATLICDEIRREDNGKLLFVGVYTPITATDESASGSSESDTSSILIRA